MIQPDKIIRSNRKTLSISVDSFGRLIVRAPRTCREERIFAFLREKEAWILRKKTETQGAGICLPPENLQGYKLLVLGKPCEIMLTDGKKVGFDGESGKIYLPNEKSKERLVKWLKENAKRIFTTVTEQTAKRMETGFRSIALTRAKSKWGSCSYDNAIRYTFRLLYTPKEVIEYVVVHELAHTKHKNHSKAFWQEVEKYVPDWKKRRNWLKVHRALMEIF